MGDFNGRVGMRLDGKEQIMGTNTYGTRNDGGSHLVNFNAGTARRKYLFQEKKRF